MRDRHGGRLRVQAVVVALVAAACGTGGGGGGQTEDPLKVAFVYNGPVGGADGWTHRHDVGRQQVEEEFGDRVDVTFVEQVDAGAASERVFEDLARQGNDVIFGTAFAFMDSMQAVAKDYPDVQFMHATGFKTSDNMTAYTIGAEEGTYIEGMAAAMASKDGKIGYLAPFPIPEVIRLLDAYTLGARSVNPDATVQIVWTNTWFDPEVEKAAADGLLNEGVSVVGQQSDSPTVGSAVQEHDAFWTGFTTDHSSEFPDVWLTASVLEWGPYYTDVISRILDESYESENYYGRMDDGLVSMAEFGSGLDGEDQARLQEQIELFSSGGAHALDGPVVDQSGKMRFDEGESPSVDQLLTLDFLVEGVIGEIPKE
jgi:basic membrane protein A and related proteins